MIRERLQAVVETTAQLPPGAQDEIAAALEEAIKRVAWSAPQMRPDVRMVFEQVMREHVADLEYLKNK
jgi:hypothetical protein